MDKLTGRYGVVIIPDKRTIKMAEAIATVLLDGYSCKYKCGGANLPHITLYHTQFSDLPLQEAKEAVKAAKSILGMERFWLSSIFSYHEDYIFWRVDCACDDKLYLAHQQVLGLSKYLNRALAVKSLQKEGLQEALTNEERASHLQYGHPLCDALFLPHITLSYGSKLGGKIVPEPAFHWNFQVDRVALAEIGDLGQVVDILL